MERGHRKRGNSGQALIITALIITLMSISTFYYVLETEKETASIGNTADPDFSTTKTSTIKTVISSLANISNGGDRKTLKTNLEKLSSELHTLSYNAEFDLSFTLLNTPPYQNGIYISWGENGYGVSSAYVVSATNVSGSVENYYSEYKTNITTAVSIDGSYEEKGSEETVNITCTVYNENGPASASKIEVFYQNQTDSSWLNANRQNNLTIANFGNGAYGISFLANTQEPMNVSVQINDLRNIFVMANMTCTQT